MTWRCAFCWSYAADADDTCPQCGRDIEAREEVTT